MLQFGKYMQKRKKKLFYDKSKHFYILFLIENKKQRLTKNQFIKRKFLVIKQIKIIKIICKFFGPSFRIYQSK